MTSSQEMIEDHYRRVERNFTVESAAEYATLVIPTGNASAPIHRWFHLKEAYSHRLLQRVLKDTEVGSRKSIRVLDPFAGGGTTVASVVDAMTDGECEKAAVYGVECNGFLHLVASTKLCAAQQPPRDLAKVAEKVAATALDVRSSGEAELPALSTFRNERFFAPTDVRELVRIREAISDAERRGADPIAVGAMRVALGASVELVSNLRRDGRALRYTEKKARPTPTDAFMEKVRLIAADLPSRSIEVEGTVLRGDGRDLVGLAQAVGKFDLVIFSPPYPNNIDYTEVYKLENWLLGFITDSQSFTGQRLRTVYSHPSLLRPDPLPCAALSAEENDALLAVTAPLVRSIPDDRYTEARRRMLRGYALDMYRTLRALVPRVRRDGRVVYVVGNSVHGHAPNQFVIAADLLIAELAVAAGLTVERIAIARQLRRRAGASAFLRESVVFLKPS